MRTTNAGSASRGTTSGICGSPAATSSAATAPRRCSGGRCPARSAASPPPRCSAAGRRARRTTRARARARSRAAAARPAAGGAAGGAAAGPAPGLVVVEALREFCSKDFQPCDQRRSREEQQAVFPYADFQNVPPGPDTLLGPGLVETPENADTRIRQLLAWLRDQPYRSVACVAHFQILTRILTKHLEPAGYDGAKYGDLTNLEIRSVPILFE
mmetsp:Transcript_103184/g.250593  ORF Transcript_103184/g.250593 Transcript_103184/m.250593 type:complete len:214 (-) Transcript_103184:73-714(-)